MRNLLFAIPTLALSASPAVAQLTNGVGLPALGARSPDTGVVPGRSLPVNRAPMPSQRPAFAGQMGAPAAVTTTPIATEIKTRGLNHPWGLAFIDDGKLLVTEKAGAMRVIDMASGVPIAGVQGLPSVVFKGDGGMLDVVTDPAFAQNRMIYFTYVEKRGEEDSGLVVAKAKLVAPEGGGNQAPMYKLEGVTTLLRATSAKEPGHYGSRLLFDREGYLFVSLGERFFYPTRAEAQSLYSIMGKVLRLTTDGKPAPGNPFDRDQQAEDHPRAEIWSYGQRNPQALAINPVDGTLWESEHGPNGGDEVNLIRRGANYGWPLVAYGNNYDRTPIYEGRTQLRDTEQPRYVWAAAVAPGGMDFYSGKLIPEWKNNLFVAALAGEHVARLVLQNDRIVGEERLLQDQHQRIRDVKQGPDGALWVVTDDADGRLIRLSPAAVKGPVVSERVR